jgi:hypothetical protein
VVGIGASAGGLEAFRLLLKSLPPDTGLAFVLVQHLDPGHESMLTSLLSKATQMPVAEVKEGMRAEPNHVYIIPPNTTMGILNGDLHLTARREPGSRHMPIDYFLRSLADDQGSGAIGVILSGAATDGTLGLKAIKAEGGITFAQDEKTAKYDGMPRSAIAAGCVDFVLSPEKIARELARIGRHPYLRVSPAEPVPLPAENDDDLRTLFLLLRDATGVDFSYYKYSTLKRRIVRRMVLHKIARLSQYLRYLRENPSELRALYEDILIHVTAFFREPETFQELKDTILPGLLRARRADEPIRVYGRRGLLHRHGPARVSRRSGGERAHPALRHRYQRGGHRAGARRDVLGKQRRRSLSGPPAPLLCEREWGISDHEVPARGFLFWENRNQSVDSRIFSCPWDENTKSIPKNRPRLIRSLTCPRLTMTGLSSEPKRSTRRR